MMDTIFAEATAPARAGIAVIRISGPKSHDAVLRLAGHPLPAPRFATLRRIRRANGQPLDQGLVLVFARGASFTGEPSAELHLHGSRAVMAAILDELSRMDGLRLAEPGEFTRRALVNGKLDLTQVEGLADLIEAETEAQRQQAERTLSGALGDLVHSWRRDLTAALALTTAMIDFAEEEDIPTTVNDEVQAHINGVYAAIAAQLAGFSQAETIRSGFEIAIVGRTNEGKSTLLNHFAGREAAITSDEPGTTRDFVEVRMDLGGIPVTFVDTAGLRVATSEIERKGVERSRTRAARADLRIFLGRWHADLDVEKRQGDIEVGSKADLTGVSGGVSGLDGTGVPQLLERIRAQLGARVASAGLVTHVRHRDALQRALPALARARQSLAEGAGAELTAAELQLALDALRCVLGLVDVENLLDEIFRRFCIGK